MFGINHLQVPETTLAFLDARNLGMQHCRLQPASQFPPDAPSSNDETCFLGRQSGSRLGMKRRNDRNLEYLSQTVVLTNSAFPLLPSPTFLYHRQGPCFKLTDGMS